MKIKDGKFVITGGASLIGSHVAEHLLESGAGEVVLFDNYSLGSAKNIDHLTADKRVQVLHGDILRTGELYDAFDGAHGVLAIAGFLTLPLGQNPALGLAVNVQGHLNVLEACRYRGVERIVFSSSIAVYGEPGEGLIEETAPFNAAAFPPAASMYAATKLIGENLCSLYAQRYGLGTASLRYSTVYGERQHYRGVNALNIAENYDRIARGEAPLIVGDGTEAHDYIHVSDVARANLAALVADVSGESFTIATGKSTNLNELVDVLLNVCGSSLQPRHVEPTRLFRVSAAPQVLLSVEKAERLLNWTPITGLAEGLGRLVAWRKQANPTVSA